MLSFSENEIDAIDLYLDQNGSITRIKSTESLNNKRLDLYLKGGIFSVTYKTLVLDLLTKRLSPSIISGFIINNAHKAGAKQSSFEPFLCKLLKKDNPDAFIKTFSDKPQNLIKGGLIGIEKTMKNL